MRSSTAERAGPDVGRVVTDDGAVMGVGDERVGMDVFVYGTLTDPGRVREVLTEYDVRDRAVLEGLHRVEGTYPTLAPGGTVAGRLLKTPEIERLDRYEGVERGLYVRVAVPVGRGADDFESSGDPVVSDTSNTVAVYVGDPAALNVESEIEWPVEGDFRTCVERYVREHAVCVRAGKGNESEN